MSKILIDEATVKLVLEALENSVDLVEEDYANTVSLYGKYPSRAQRLIGMETMRDDHIKAITALREALAQPAVAEQHKQEPVAEIVSNINGCLSTKWYEEWTPNQGDKLYTIPQPAQIAGFDVVLDESMSPNTMKFVQPAQQEPVATVRTWHKNGRQHAELDDWGLAIALLPDGMHNLYTTPQPAQQKPVATGQHLDRCANFSE